jgi:hypothetical protein
MQSLTLVFSLPGFTWEEVYWGNAISAFVASTVATARAKILAPPAQIADVRITDTTLPHWAVYLIAGTFQGQGSYVDTSIPLLQTQSDRAYSVALAVSYNPIGSISRRFLGGVPDSLVAEVAAGQTPGGINPNTGPAFQIAYTAFSGVLANYGLGWLRRLYAGGVKVDQVLGNGPANAPIGLVTSTPIVIPPLPSESVLVKGFRANNTKYKNIGGAYFVSTDPSAPAPPAGKSVYYLLGTTLSQFGNSIKEGKIYPYATALVQYVTNTTEISYNLIEKATHRKRGVKELAPVGRSKIRR